MLVYCTSIWNILQTFGIFGRNLVYFPPFSYFEPIIYASSGDNPKTLIYNASVVKIYNTTINLARFNNKKIL
jgi:hypothetical protein